MAIAVRSTSYGVSIADTGVATSRPAGSVAGDVLVLIGIEFTTASDANGLTTPTGWTLKNQFLTNGGKQTENVYARLSDGTATDTPTLADAVGGTSSQICWVMLALTGAQTAFDGVVSSTSGSATTIQTATSLTTTAAGSLLIGYWLSQPATGATGRFYGSVGMTVQANPQQTAGILANFCVATEVLGAAGATGTRSATSSWTLGATDTYATALFAVKESTTVTLINDGTIITNTAAVQFASSW